MSEFDMVKHLEIRHDIELGDEAEAAVYTRPNLDLLTICSQISVPNPHALLHRDLIQLSEVVCLRHILWLCLAIVVQERRVIVRNALVILDVSKVVE